jgi:hypothetical protein
METIWECTKVLAFMGAVGVGLTGAGLFAVHAPNWARALWAHEKKLRGMR